MTVWETVVAGSTLASGTFWEHLNAQGGTGGTPGETIYIEGFNVYEDSDMFYLYLEADTEDVFDDSETFVIHDGQEELIIEDDDE